MPMQVYFILDAVKDQVLIDCSKSAACRLRRLRFWCGESNITLLRLLHGGPVLCDSFQQRMLRWHVKGNWYTASEEVLQFARTLTCPTKAVASAELVHTLPEIAVVD